MEKAILVETPRASTATLDFDNLVYTHARLVLNVAYAVLRNSEDAEDVAQDTFFRAFRSPELGRVEQMRTWLCRIAWRLALNRLHQRTGIFKRVQTDERLQILPTREPGAEELLMKKERSALLERLLSSMPRNLRETFVLCTVEEMTSRCAAEILGISDSSVRDRLARARKLLKEKLGSFMEGNNEG